MPLSYSAQESKYSMVYYPDIFNCRTFDEYKQTTKKYYGLPYSFTDTPDDGDKWKEYPETEGYNHYFKYEDDTNSSGFRGNDWKSEVDICYYGCSFTYGVGLPYDATWCSMIDKHFGYKSNNFGFSGASADEMLNLFLSGTRFIKMRKAFFLFPEIHRHTMPFIHPKTKNKKTLNLHPTYEQSYKDKEVRDLARTYFTLPDIYFEDKFRLACHKIFTITEMMNIEVYISAWHSNLGALSLLSQNYPHVKLVPKVLCDGRARDAFTRPWGHFGINNSIELSNHFIKIEEVTTT